MELTTSNFKGYSEYKKTLDIEISNVAVGFVKIGYLLKVARDTNVLYESGYKSVAEFAQAEYGLTKDIVSRYIAINDRYSENGYSMELAAPYQGYGYAKLAEMLTLPPAVVEVLDESLTKDEIREIKAEIKAEQQISDIEVLLEDKEHSDDESMIKLALLRYMEDDVEAFKVIHSTVDDMHFDEAKVEKMLDALAPSGIAMHVVRIPGIGRLIMSIRGKDKPVEVVNSRTGEKESVSWKDVYAVIENTFGRFSDAGESYEALYNKSMPEPVVEPAVEVAPAQPEKQDKPKPKKKVTTPKKQEVHNEPEKVESVSVEEVHGVTAAIEDVDTESDEREKSNEKSQEEAIHPERLSEDELETIWHEIEQAGGNVIDFVDDTSSWDVIQNKVLYEDITKAYNNAINLAAGLEKLMIDMKRSGIREENN